MKILIYNKTKRGMDYNKAKKEVEMEIEQCMENSEKVKKDE